MNNKSRMKHRASIIVTLVCSMFCFYVGSALADEDGLARNHPVAVTTGDLSVPLDELELMLKPLKSDEIKVEADAWFSLLREAVYQLNQAKLDLKRQKNVINEANSIKVQQATRDESGESTEQVVAEDEALDKIAALREQRTGLIDRLSLVLDAYTKKAGLTDDQKEPDTVLAYRNYIKVNHGLDVDVSDTRSAWSTLIKWFQSKEGGKRWGRHIGVFISAVLGFWLLGVLLSRVVKKALSFSRHTSLIMKQFIVKAVRTILIFIGVLIGLSALEVNVTPVLAVIGATGFIVAFALQDTLSNFASGLMILFYRPFDVGDWVDVSGQIGKVRSMTLVTTTIMTPDNKLMIVPNNSIWGNIITNVTGSSERRVDLEFGIGYDADLDRAREVLEDIMTAHELVLDEPAAVVHVHELADSSVNFICRPWVKTDDYWTVYWDITREVKLRFDAEGISIPFPQRDMHIYDHGTKSGDTHIKESPDHAQQSRSEESDPPAM